MKTTNLLWTLLSALCLASPHAWAQRAGETVAEPAPVQPQIIHLNDGTKLTLLGTSYGTRHMAPGYEHLRTANWVSTAPNTTVVWIQEEGQQRPSCQLLVSDRANTGCVNLEPRQGSLVKPGVWLQSYALTAFPRWDKETILRVRPYMGAPSQEQFVLTNPVPGTLAPWSPEPLPATKSAGELEVTLTRLIAGAPKPYREGSSPPRPNDPANQCVHLDFNFRVNGQPSTNWQAWPVETTDATGNRSRGLIYAYPKDGLTPSYPDRVHPSFPPENDGYYFQPGLWPAQPWKVRLEFIQRFNFRDADTITFTNLPVKRGSQKDWEEEWNAWDIRKTDFPFQVTPATVNGVHLQLLPPLLVTNRWQSSQRDLSVIIGADPGFNPKGMHLTVVAATDDQGRELRSAEQPAWAGHYSISFSGVHDDIQALNLSLALHQSRFVEFTVQPARQ